MTLAVACIGCTAPQSGPAPLTPQGASGQPSVAPSAIEPGRQSSGGVASPGPTTTPLTTTPPPPPAPQVRFDPAAALRTVRFLSGEVGPREAGSASYRRAARWIQRHFEASGYRVHLQPVRVPAGNSWGVDVPAGTTWNVIATVPGFEPTRPHLVIGAHLDTVPQAPGAEDNASGVAVLLELARMAAQASTRLPVQFVAFGGEEPRGSGDRLHHFGSTAMIDQMSAMERESVVAMVALDRVGVGTSVPVCTGGVERPVARAALLRVAASMGIPAQACLNTGSDHWSFEKAGVPAARVGGTSYEAYHSAADVPTVVNPHQLTRVAHLLWAWITA